MTAGTTNQPYLLIKNHKSMEIKTTFGLGDKVWVIKDSKAHEITIDTIVIEADGVKYGERYDTYRESQCFKSKNTLIEYVMSND